MITNSDANLLSIPHAPIEGYRLPANYLDDLINSERLVILHFLRHLGCAFCKHSVDKFRKLCESTKFPPIYFVHSSPAEVGEAFFQERFPTAAHIADPEHKLYKLFGIKRMPYWKLFSPVFITRMIYLSLSGYPNEYNGYGDTKMLTGTFLFKDGKLLWSHRATMPGDDLDLSKLGLKK
jgi:hypothetical protein